MSTEEFQRKLTAILSADVQGYSRLMGEDEDSTVRTLTAYRALMISLIQKHRGHVVDTPGDNLLAKFGSVMDAVRCAVEIQEELRVRNSELSENRRMLYRIGINLGDVIEEGDRIYGDGINVAARIEGLADGGGICVSGSVYDSIRNKLSMSYESLGEHNVKNIKNPVRVYQIKMGPEPAKAAEKGKKAGFGTWQRMALSAVAIIILGVVAVWYYAFRQGPVVSDVEETPKTIAVLPFADMSPGKDQDYFVDGLSEEIINCLTKISDLHVTSRTSSFTFKNSDKTAQEIAEILGREYILEGSVRKVGNALRITAQLIHAADDRHLWSETYDKELKDILDIQEDIANSVADKLKLTLEALKLLGGTEDIEAYEYYLVAKGQQFSGTTTATSRALESIDAAIAIDSDFARAWALKATLHNMQTVYGPSDLAGSEREKALYAAEKAVDLEPNLATGYVSLGFTKIGKGEWIEAEADFRKALELSDETLSSDEIIYAAVYYIAVGYCQKAIDLLTEGRRNDPRNANLHALYLYPLVFTGDYQRIENEYDYGVELFGDEWVIGDYFYIQAMSRPGIQFPVDLSLTFLGTYSIIQEKINDIVLENLESPKMGIMELGKLYQDENNLSSQEYNILSFWSSYMGDPDLAMDVMEKGYHADPTGLYVAWAPIKREVRQLPRFKEFLREIGLVDYWNEFGWPDICQPLDNGDFVCD